MHSILIRVAGFVKFNYVSWKVVLEYLQVELYNEVFVIRARLLIFMFCLLWSYICLFVCLFCLVDHVWHRSGKATNGSYGPSKQLLIFCTPTRKLLQKMSGSLFEIKYFNLAVNDQIFRYLVTFICLMPVGCAQEPLDISLASVELVL